MEFSPIDTTRLIDALLLRAKYTDKWAGIRDLIQNAMDACRVRRELLERLGSDPDAYRPTITVILDPENGAATIKDNGVGMTAKTLRKYFLTIGSSYYSSADFAQQKFKFQPYGRLGVGVLSCFTLSDRVFVRTRYFDETDGYDLEMRKGQNFVHLNKVVGRKFDGTEIVLDYSQFISVVKNEIELQRFLENTFISEDIQLHLKIRTTQHIVISGKVDAKDGKKLENLDTSIRSMRINGRIESFISVLKQFMQSLSNRDLLAFDEKHAKMITLSLLLYGGFYVRNSEFETEAGYIDILLTKNIQHESFTNYEWLIELKYIKFQNRNSLQQIRKDGLAQLKRYADSPRIRDSFRSNWLRKVLITFVGKNEIYIDYLD